MTGEAYEHSRSRPEKSRERAAADRRLMNLHRKIVMYAMISLGSCLYGGLMYMISTRATTTVLGLLLVGVMSALIAAASGTLLILTVLIRGRLLRGAGFRESAFWSEGYGEDEYRRAFRDGYGFGPEAGDGSSNDENTANLRQ
ncbi:MAG: hypothetical protein GX099_03495 [Clostridiaceae bacterium]|nr:hypothetical protein [Clostridiaceae bacterium]